MQCRSFAAPRESISSAIFLIGLAALFYFDWFWPGILVLVGVTGVAEALLRQWMPEPDEIPLKVENPEGEPPAAQPPAATLIYPAKCPSCGAATPETVQEATGQEKVICPYCRSQLQPIAGPTRAGKNPQP